MSVVISGGQMWQRSLFKNYLFGSEKNPFLFNSNAIVSDIWGIIRGRFG